MFKIPTVVFEGTKIEDVLKTVLEKVDFAIQAKRGIMRKSIYDDIIQYVKEQVSHKGRIVLGEVWILEKVFSAGKNKNQQLSQMIGVYPQHNKKSLFHFAREVSQIIYEQGFKSEILDFIVKKILLDIPKKLSESFTVKVVENDFFIIKK